MRVSKLPTPRATITAYRRSWYNDFIMSLSSATNDPKWLGKPVPKLCQIPQTNCQPRQKVCLHTSRTRELSDAPFGIPKSASGSSRVPPVIIKYEQGRTFWNRGEHSAGIGKEVAKVDILSVQFFRVGTTLSSPFPNFLLQYPDIKNPLSLGCLVIKIGSDHRISTNFSKKAIQILSLCHTFPSFWHAHTKLYLEQTFHVLERIFLFL